MEDTPLPSRLQHRIGIFGSVVAGVVAVTPLALALALHTADGSGHSDLLVIAGSLWLAGIAMYRILARAHEQRRRDVLRRALAEARTAHLASSKEFRETLHQQLADLDHIIDISELLLEEGIVDPSRVLDNVGLINSRAREAQRLVEDALAEMGIEAGSTRLKMEQVDARTLIEDIAAPFVRTGSHITTGGSQHFVATDATVLRLVLRGLVARAVEICADEIDISVMQNGDVVVLTVADRGPDRSDDGLKALSPVIKSLVVAVGGDLTYDRALKWNRYAISLPTGTSPTESQSEGTPLDVLGAVTAQPAMSGGEHLDGKSLPAIKPDLKITFVETPVPDRKRSVAALRRGTLAAR